MDEQPYQPFSGEATCPKCGGDMDTTWQPAGTIYHSPGVVMEARGPEWMLRECLGCGYSWPEMCRDAYPDTVLRQS